MMNDAVRLNLTPAANRAAAISGESEFGWPGLVPKHLKNAPPDQGGMYQPKAPPEEFEPFTGAS